VGENDMADLKIFFEILLLLAFGGMGLFMIYKIIKILNHIEEYAKIAALYATAMSKLDGREKLQGMIEKLTGKKYDRLMNYDDLEELIEKLEESKK